MTRKKILLAAESDFSCDWDKSFSGQGPYQLLIAATGVEAYETAVFERPELIVMKVQLPELNGDECCRRLKAHPELRSIPVVLLSESSETAELERCRRSGCEDLLQWPIDWELFSEVCLKYLQPNQRITPRVAVQMSVHFGFGTDRKKLTHYSINVSTGGLFIETANPLPIDTPLSLEFSLPGHQVPVQCRGRVAWLNSPGRKQHPRLPLGMGVQFVDLSLEDMRLVRSFIHQELEGSH